MYEDLRLGKITKDAAFEKRSKEIDDTLAAVDEKFKDSWLSYPTMKTIGQMLTVSGDTAAKGAALGMGAGALGLGALALAGAPVAVPASLGALGLMTMSGAVMETSKEVEGGLAYKDMVLMMTLPDDCPERSALLMAPWKPSVMLCSRSSEGSSLA